MFNFLIRILCLYIRVGKYYVVGAGYPTCRGYLVPYKGERYNLPEWHRGMKLATPKEKFNQVHSPWHGPLPPWALFGFYWRGFMGIRRDWQGFWLLGGFYLSRSPNQLLWTFLIFFYKVICHFWGHNKPHMTTCFQQQSIYSVIISVFRKYVYKTN